MKETIHFAHGNGFPSPCYRQLLMALEKKFNCCFIDRIGHSPQFPVTENWHHLVDEMILSIQNQASKPVIAVGHSLGGVLSFRAAVERPDLFKAVILLDSPILGRFKSNLLRVTKAFGMIDHLTPAFRTKGRRIRWTTREEVLRYLKEKQLFQTFTEECLQDYIDYGMNKENTGYSLRFDRGIEYQIYRTMPHILYQDQGKLKIPAVLIHGSQSHVVDRLDRYNMKKHYHILCEEIKGTHMFPMESPQKTAERIINHIQESFTVP